MTAETMTPELRDDLLALSPATLVEIIEEHRKFIFAHIEMANNLTGMHQSWLGACNTLHDELVMKTSHLIGPASGGALPN